MDWEQFLSQDQSKGRVVIAYASRSLRPTEKNMDNYSSMKLELFALKWAVTEKFRDYLLGNKFKVYTDNNPLFLFRVQSWELLKCAGSLNCLSLISICSIGQGNLMLMQMR